MFNTHSRTVLSRGSAPTTVLCSSTMQHSSCAARSGGSRAARRGAAGALRERDAHACCAPHRGCCAADGQPRSRWRAGKQREASGAPASSGGKRSMLRLRALHLPLTPALLHGVYAASMQRQRAAYNTQRNAALEFEDTGVVSR
jgi:hypothetical protein